MDNHELTKDNGFVTEEMKDEMSEKGWELGEKMGSMNGDNEEQTVESIREELKSQDDNPNRRPVQLKSHNRKTWPSLLAMIIVWFNLLYWQLLFFYWNKSDSFTAIGLVKLSKSAHEPLLALRPLGLYTGLYFLYFFHVIIFYIRAAGPACSNLNIWYYSDVGSCLATGYGLLLQ